MKVVISGGSEHLKVITKEVVEWCLKYFEIKNKDELQFNIKIHPRNDCWGSCEQGKGKRNYEIYVANNQTIRNFVATLVHEMVHVKQWETGCWVGEGEREAEKLQYLLTDEIWKKGLI